MVTIVVSGKAGKVGKTSLIADILQRLHLKTGVIKTSVTEGNEGTMVTDDPAVIKDPGTDTALFVENGAERVVYLRCDYEQLEDSLARARELVGNVEYLIIEGNSVQDFINPTLVIYLDREDVEAKESANKAAEKADVFYKYEDLSGLFQGEKTLKDIPFKFNIEQISCFKAHLLSEIIGIKVPVLGKMLDKDEIRINHCQLGCF